MSEDTDPSRIGGSPGGNGWWSEIGGFKRGLLVALAVFVFNLAILFAMDLIPGETWNEWRASGDLDGTHAMLAFVFAVIEVVAVLVLNRPKRGPDGATQFFLLSSCCCRFAH